MRQKISLKDFTFMFANECSPQILVSTNNNTFPEDLRFDDIRLNNLFVKLWRSEEGKSGSNLLDRAIDKVLFRPAYTNIVKDLDITQIMPSVNNDGYVYYYKAGEFHHIDGITWVFELFLEDESKNA